MDLLARINAQNAEIERSPAELPGRPTVIRTQQAMGAHADSRLAEQLQHSHLQPPVPSVTEESLRAQERELDRQLQMERSKPHNAPRIQKPPSTLAHNKENHSRGSIPLMPGGRPPATATPSDARSMVPSERRRRPVHFSHLMVKESATSQMEEFMNPATSIRDQMRRAGVEPKNHQREQRERIHELAMQRKQEAQSAAAREDEKKRKEQALRERSRMMHQTAQAQGPSAYPEVSERVVSAGRRASKTQEESTRHTPGAVPEYLRRRKEQWAAEAEAEAKKAAAEAECPPGLRLVGPEEKERILQTLAEEKAKSTLELQSLPFVVKTKATQLRKDQLEQRLQQIDQATAEYLKEKVFVPAG